MPKEVKKLKAKKEKREQRRKRKRRTRRREAVEEHSHPESKITHASVNSATGDLESGNRLLTTLFQCLSSSQMVISPLVRSWSIITIITITESAVQSFAQKKVFLSLTTRS